MHTSDSIAKVPLGTGPPTKAELITHYPAKFTWTQLRAFINAGDLALLKRDKALQKRYDTWAIGIKEKYGSNGNYLVNHRLQWGKPDTQSVLRSELDDVIPDVAPTVRTPAFTQTDEVDLKGKEYFTADSQKDLISIIQNDWPYSVPAEIEHTLIWTKLPLIHPGLVHPSISARIEQDGIWGFTGAVTPPPPPSDLSSYMGALRDEWGMSIDKLTISSEPTAEERRHIDHVGREVAEFVRRRWNESQWETAWFVNPPRLQSVPELAHVHVFARKKTAEEIQSSSRP